MDEIILTLDEHETNALVDATKRDEYRIRYAVRAVIFDGNGAVPLLHAVVRNYYKLPGGGVDDNEDLHTALKRELEEEIGSCAMITRELGQILEWRDSERLKQVSFCYTAILQGDKGIPRFTEKELAGGFEVVWATDIKHALSLVEMAVDRDDVEVSFMTTRDSTILRTAARKLT